MYCSSKALGPPEHEQCGVACGESRSVLALGLSGLRGFGSTFDMWCLACMCGDSGAVSACVCASSVLVCATFTHPPLPSACLGRASSLRTRLCVCVCVCAYVVSAGVCASLGFESSAVGGAGCVCAQFTCCGLCTSARARSVCVLCCAHPMLLVRRLCLVRSRMIPFIDMSAWQLLCRSRVNKLAHV